MWLNSTFSLPIKTEWLSKGISTTAFFLAPIRNIIPMEEFIETFKAKTKFLEYKIITTKIKKSLEYKDQPLYSESLPRNSSLNDLLNLSMKGCSKLYIRMKDSYNHVLNNIVTKMNIEMETISFGRSFMKHQLQYKDTFI